MTHPLDPLCEAEIVRASAIASEHLGSPASLRFPLVAAQVATGRNAREKSLRGHLRAFKSRWFGTQPVTDFIPYMIMPFATVEDQFVDDVRVMGNVLHRLRVPRRVAEARQLVEDGVMIEGYGRLAEIARWITEYRIRAGAAA